MTTDSQEILVFELRNRIDKYFYIVVQNLRDQIPKIIGHFLLRKFGENLEVEILNSLNKNNYCLDSFNESQTTTQYRQKLKHELTALSNAENLLVNEFGFGFDLKTDLQL